MKFILLAYVTSLAVYAAAEPSCPPASDVEIVVYFPHPSDCNKFLTCHWGNLVELSCPNGTFWNDNAKTCDFKANVHCSLEPEPTMEPSTTTEQPTTSTTEYQTTTSTTEVPSTSAAPSGKCPEQYNPDHQVYLSHQDCTKYYICTWGGVAIEQKCPANLHWNQLLSYCDYPQQAGCATSSSSTSAPNSPSSPSPTTTMTEIQTTTTTTELQTTTSTTEVPSTSAAPAGKCPEQYNPDIQVYLPHEDCTKYYICTWGGSAVEQQCPANFHWNQQLSYCDYPQQAGCASSSTSTSAPTSTPSSPQPTTTTPELQTTTTTTEFQTTTSTTEFPSTSTTSVTSVAPAEKCPEQYNPDHLVYLPHEDCTKYYICTWGGVAVEQKCPANLHWNQLRSYCDYPQQAGCASSSPSTSASTSNPSSPPSTFITTEFQSITSTTEVLSTSATPAGKCPEQYNPDHLVYLPHEDCTKYYICTWGGVAVAQKCPANLHWNHQLSYCDYPQQAGCASTSAPTAASSTPVSTTTPTPAPHSANDCPEVYDPSHQVYFPHKDCTKYYICTYEGNKLEQNCPSGLHWSQSHNYCDHPELAQCIAA